MGTSCKERGNVTLKRQTTKKKETNQTYTKYQKLYKQKNNLQRDILQIFIHIYGTIYLSIFYLHGFIHVFKSSFFLFIT